MSPATFIRDVAPLCVDGFVAQIAYGRLVRSRAKFHRLLRTLLNGKRRKSGALPFGISAQLVNTAKQSHNTDL